MTEIFLDCFANFATITSLFSVSALKFSKGSGMRKGVKDMVSYRTRKGIKHSINNNNKSFCHIYDTTDSSPTIISHPELTLHSIDVL